MDKQLYHLFANRDYFEPYTYFSWKHDELASCTEFNNITDQGALLHFMYEKYGKNDHDLVLKWENFNHKKQHVDTASSEYFLMLSEGFYLFIEAGRARLLYGGNCNQEKKNDYSQSIATFIENIEPEKKKFYMLVKDKREFFLQSFPVSNTQIDLENNYNHDLQSGHVKIMEFLNHESKNGLILLHGKPGTGKTNYLRHLITTVNQKIIFFPVQFMDQLSNPAFLPFITQHDRSVLIMEDCERLVQARNPATDSTGLANLLNLSDGLLGDALSLKVICTFNCDLGKIDPAILRKGRLAFRYEFMELSAEKANSLSKSLGYTNTYTKPVTLAEVYNPEQNEVEKEEKGFGFRITKAV